MEVQLPDLLTTSLASTSAALASAATVAAKPAAAQKGLANRESGFDVMLAGNLAEPVAAISSFAEGGKNLPDVPGIALPDLPRIALPGMPVLPELPVQIEAGNPGLVLDSAAAPGSARPVPVTIVDVSTHSANQGASAEDARRSAFERILPQPGAAMRPARVAQAAAGAVPTAGAARFLDEAASPPSIPKRGSVPSLSPVPLESANIIPVKSGVANAPIVQIAAEPLVQGDAAIPTAQLLRASTSLRTMGAEQASPPGTVDMPADEPVSPQPSSERGSAPRVAAIQTGAASFEAGSSNTGQPVLAPLAQAGTSGSASIMTSAPTQLAAPADLDAMIDRLVEARQTAQSGQARISVSHAEFGQVGIRIEQLAATGALGVTLNSADPDFAPAVQAALADRSGERAPDRGTASDSTRQEFSASRNGEGFAQGNQSASGDARSSGDQPRSAAVTAPRAGDEDIAPGGEHDESALPHNAASTGRYA